MRQQKRGHIINVSSLSRLSAIPLLGILRARCRRDRAYLLAELTIKMAASRTTLSGGEACPEPVGLEAPGHRPPVLGERNVRHAGMLPAQAPRGLPVADDEDLLLVGGHFRSARGSRRPDVAPP